MDWEQLLEIEYKQQGDQYRWIGQQQSYVLTFYGTVAAFAAATMAAIKPQSGCLAEYYHWLGIVLVLIGLLGCLVGIGLLHSRSMQRRIQWYLTSILLQLANIVNANKQLNFPALRFRSLCTTGGEFRLLDTMNLTILIALLSGEALFIVGVLLFGWSEAMIKKETAILVTEILTPIIWILSIILVPRHFMNKETERMKALHCEASKSRGLEIVRTKFGIPLDPNEADVPQQR